MVLTYIWLCAAIAALLLYLWQTYSKLSSAGVRHLPVVPFLGNMTWTLLRQEHFTEYLMRIHNTFPDDKIVGQYEMVDPVYMMKDIEMIKRITVRDFEHFVDRRGFTDTADKLFGRSLLLLQGDRWKAMRSTLSPAFTSSKIRLMVPFMMEVGEAMNKALKQKMEDSGKVYIDVETRDLCTRYACDVIASCAFGLKVDSQTKDNQFYSMSSEISAFDFKRILKILFYRVSPRISKLLKLQFSSPQISDFFTQVVLGTMKDREDRHITRHDMINLLMEVKKGQLQHDKDAKDTDAGFATVEESAVGKKQHDIEWSDTDLVAQAALFLFAGFETISTAMSFLLHELALNSEVQDRLATEIREHDELNGGKFDYNSIQKMSYLDMVVSEGLRLWPGAPFVDRRCVKDYNAGRPNSQATKDLIIREGDSINIPIWIFHRSPEFFPDPERFDPERFSEQNRAKIKPFSYFPFGLGPRNCIGSRFALCEMKVMVYQLLREMEVYPTDRTCFPTKLTTEGFSLRIRGGAWVRLRLRTK